jgi:outer membrane protein OmpA-like peptidoglycan-associated protein
MAKQPLRSMLHLQMGQEVLYLLMTIGLMSSLVLIVYARLLYIENANLKAAAAGVAGPEPGAGPSEPRPDQPPIITLTEAQGYSFASGSAELSDEFRALVAHQIVPRILEISSQYDARVIEVIGHTDEIPVHSGNSTVDRDLLGFLIRPSSVEPVVADNVGLGMVRAGSVLRELRSDPRLSALTILPLSAGQTTTTHQELSLGASSPQDDATRRRIEIRVRRHVGD